MSTLAFAEHVFNPEAHAQYLDISQLEAEKAEFEFDDVTYSIYYGYHGSMDDSMSDILADPTVKELTINQERKSIEVVFEDIPKKTDFWLRIPFEVLAADKEQYQLFIDGVDTGYDLMKMPDGYVIGMIISEDTKHIEIMGTNVIPEFGTYPVLILGLSILGLVYFMRKSSFGVNWTRIN
ncbi:MAG: PEFG-CTERM sorting domain-containing protein [Nitrosopumilus sp.]|nr:PEFG-CTERM sorting domain-containing protein [Nitrosopumilus sp.]